MSICPNCGKEGPHFVPPSTGDEGFFACEQLNKYATDEQRLRVLQKYICDYVYHGGSALVLENRAGYALHQLAAEKDKEKFALWATINEKDARIKELESEPKITDCISHRCKKHYQVPVHNHNEHSGAECGGCIIEEKDQQIAALKEKVEKGDALISEILGEVVKWSGDRQSSGDACVNIESKLLAANGKEKE